MRVRHIRFSSKEIEILKKDERVKYIDQYEIRFTLEFRQQLYDEIAPYFNTAKLRETLKKSGFGCNFHYKIIDSLVKNFKKRRPVGAKNNTKYLPNLVMKPDLSYNEYLLSTPYFEKGKRGIKPTERLLNELYSNYPQVSVQDYLKSLNIDINKLGYQRIYLLEGEIKQPTLKENYFSNEQIIALKENPYVKRITSTQFSLVDSFYNEAIIFKDLHIDEILKIFEINPNWLNYIRKTNIKYNINSWITKDVKLLNDNIELLVKIEKNKYNKLKEMTAATFKMFNEYLKKCSCKNKKDICILIKEIANDNNCFYKTRELLKLFGISKSSYYHILKSKEYGAYEEKKNVADNDDVEKIIMVINKNKYPKGNRMIYMLLGRLGHHMSRGKIYRLCHKFNISCSIRKCNNSRRSAKALLERNCKPNLVKRKFKLSKPGDITLTDVSYLKCPFGTVYLSALKDACSGKIKLLISKNNDLNLGLDTLNELKINDSDEYKLFHSDQGTLYLNDAFQQKLKDLGYVQSMSKRGNCWDNAPQESFFGHLKDEVSFANCNSLDDVIKEIKDYEYYYNNERPQWTRNMMTPIEFEAYINGMDSDAYKDYYTKELEKYNKMMKKATLNAINRAKNIGV